MTYHIALVDGETHRHVTIEREFDTDAIDHAKHMLRNRGAHAFVTVGVESGGEGPLIPIYDSRDRVCRQA